MTPTTQAMQDAAPQLYEACELFQSYIEHLKDGFYRFGKLTADEFAEETIACGIEQRLKAALAKADGEAEEPIVRPEPIRVPGNEVTIDIARQEEMNDYSSRGGNE